VPPKKSNAFKIGSISFSVMGVRDQHADFPSEESRGEEPCPFSPHRGFLIPHPSPFSIQYIFKFITVLRILLSQRKASPFL
jgi:hypothetical protein